MAGHRLSHLKLQVSLPLLKLHQENYLSELKLLIVRPVLKIELIMIKEESFKHLPFLKYA